MMKNLLFSGMIASGICTGSLSAQETITPNWSNNMVPTSFIENKGQFDGFNKKSDKIKFAIDYNPMHVFFTAEGLTYRFDQYIKNENRKKGDITKPKRLIQTELIHLTWENSNPDVKIITKNQTKDFHTYAMLSKDRKTKYDISNVRGYEKIIYKNLYPKIDAEYIINPKGGYKYSLILHPGADASLIKMNYSGAKAISINEAGQLVISTENGDIVEYAPASFYTADQQKLVASKFVINGNTVSFQLADYDHSKSLTIDPWVFTPTLANSNGVWECDHDGAGNAYFIGGDMPMKLLKYNAAGTLQWTYNTPYDTANYWLGTLATDNAGNSYVTAGSTAEIIKVNTAAGTVWSNSGGALDEYWSITFNCDQTKLIVGGTRLGFFPPAGSHGVIFDISTTTGGQLAMQEVASTRPGFIIDDINEVRAVSSSYNAKYYFLTLDTVGAINQNLSACGGDPVFVTNSGYNFAYKCENFKPNNGNGGIPAIRANASFFYTQDGNTVDKRDLVTGAIITSVPITGGISTASFGFNQAGNSGIDLDDCGNVYVGSGDRIIKYDANLVFISQTMLPYKVSDVSVSTGGDVIVCGTTGTSSSTSRTGYAQSINMSACAPLTLVCCDATICNPGDVCTTDAPFAISVTTAGGTFAGPGVNPTTGVFDPAVAGIGTHTITYTLACGSGTMYITVLNCSALSVCVEPSGQLTVSGGTGPYSWDEWEAASSTPITNSAQCTACGYTWFFGTCLNGVVPMTSCSSPAGWSNFATGTTVTAPVGSDTIQVTGASGNLVIYNVSALPACTTATCPPITVNTTSIVNVACFGGSTGSFSGSTTGGTGPYDYILYNSGGGTVATFNNITGSQSFGTLPAGTYTLSSTDNNGCPETETITITQPASAVSVSLVSSTNASCGVSNGSATVSGSGGTGAITYSWNTTPVQTGPTASGLAAGTYTVTATDANSCTTTFNVTISNTSGPTASLTSSTNVLCNGGTTGTATMSGSGGTGSLSYSWNTTPVQTTPTASGLGVGTYIGTVTDASGCTSTVSVTITEPSAISVSASATDASCGASNGTATATASGGTGTLDYSWNSTPIQTTPTASGLPAGAYTVTITDDNGCTSTAVANVNSIGGATLALGSQTDNLCNGDANGAATVNASGGTGTLNYSWSTTPVQTTPTATGLTAGTYTLTVTDGAGCVSSFTVTIAEPTAISLSTSTVDATCGASNGSATATASGGTGTLDYSWNTTPVQTTPTATALAPGAYTVTITDDNGCIATQVANVNSIGGATLSLSSQTNVNCNGNANGSATINATGGSGSLSYSWNTSPVQTTPSATGLGGGTYTLTVTDGAGCVSTFTVTITEPAAISLSATGSVASCGVNDGTASATASGGSGTLSYSWNTTPVQTTSTATGLAPGTYTVTVTDANGCTATQTASVTTVGGPTISTSSVTNVLCNGGSNGAATVAGSGGTGTLTYSWNTSPTQTGPTATNLPAGTYTATVTDANNCTATQTVTISQPAAIAITITTTPTDCAASNGTATANVTGGTGAYNYSWSPGGSTSSTATGLAFGSYNVTVTDANGCTSTGSTSIVTATTAFIDAGPTVTIEPGDSVMLTPAGGVSYIWSPATGLSCTTCANPYASPDETTTYTVTAVDGNGCFGTDTVTVIVDAVCGKIFVPNAFSPNGDLENDELCVYGGCISSLYFVIYDRWGEKVFESEDPTRCWDGKLRTKDGNNAVFVYYLTATLENGDVVKRSGNISLIK